MCLWSIVGPGGTRFGAWLGPIAGVQAWIDAWNPRRTEIVVSDYAPCSGRIVANAGVARALHAAAGRVLRIPARCTLLLEADGSHPAMVVPSGTQVRCEGSDSGILLARRVCTGGSTPGAACATGQECGGAARCVLDGNARREFAPNGTAVVVGFASGASDVRIVGCRIDVGQADAYGRCVGGSSAGRACNQSAPCDDGGACEPAHRKPSGPGRVTVIDAGGVPRTRIDGLRIRDHCDGPFTIRTGHTATIENVDTTDTALPLDPLAPFCAPEHGIAVAGVSRVAHNTVRGADRAISAEGQLPSVIEGNTVRVDPPARHSTVRGVGIWTATMGGQVTGNYVTCRAAERRSKSAPRGTGILVARDQQIVDHNRVALCFHGIEVAQQSGNVTIDHNRVVFGAGAKLVLAQYGNTVTGNYFAWDTGSPELSPPGRTCRGGATPRAICATDAECDGGTCQVEPVIWVGLDGEVASADTNHILIGASNTIHSNWPGVSGIRLADMGRRCKNGPRSGHACATTTDCATGRCEATHHHNLTITGNQILVNKSDTVGIDLGDLTSGDTTANVVLIAGNHFGHVGDAVVPLAVRLPANAALATGIAVVNNFGHVGTLIEGWSTTSGVRSGNMTGADLRPLPTGEPAPDSPSPVPPIVPDH